jgi:methionyl-tRNA synthetase
MFDKKRYLITSALPYANGPLHIGHLAGAYLTGDIYARYLRLMGKDVVYVCGSDEHGAAITIRAKKDGVTPQEIIDKYDAQFRDTFQKMGIKFDIFHRTSSAMHHDTAQEFFLNLHKNNEFVEQESKQYYDESANQFLADRYIIGTCPKCANPDAYGDQCERCGSTLSPTELINPRSTLSGATPILKDTKHWYLPLDRYTDWLREFIEKGSVDGKQLHDATDWKAHVVGQCKSWLDGGLEPRAITRDLDWGIPVPVKDAEGKVLYVWFDAPIGYISATKQWALDSGKDWKPYWQNEDTALIHFIGKDNIVFHCLIFPAILKAYKGDAGEQYILPVNVPANQFMNLEGRKISTSKNWAVWVHEYVEEFAGKEDVLRYNMIKLMPEQKDSEFTWKGFQETNNNELVNNIANFINRVIVLTNKYYEGVVPEINYDQPFASSKNATETSFIDMELLDLYDKIHELGTFIETFNFRDALRTLMEISSIGNQLLQFNEPWSRQKTDPEQVKVVMVTALQIVTAISVICRPFMPFTSDRLREMLNLAPIADNGDLLQIKDALSEGALILPEGHRIGEAQHLFTRISDEVIAAQVKKLKDSDAENQAALAAEPVAIQYPPIKETIAFEDFNKIDLRTGTIVSAEKVKGAKKLLQLQIDLGFETRQIVSGIAEHFEPEAIIGQQVVVVANLAPRELRGTTSNGMILMGEDEKGNLAFVNPKDGFSNGFFVK